MSEISNYFFVYNNCPFKIGSFLNFDRNYFVSSNIECAPKGRFVKGFYFLTIYNNIYYKCMFLKLI